MRHHLQFIRAVFTAVVLFSLAAVAAGVEVALEGFLRDVFADGSDDDAAGIVREHAFHESTQSLAFFPVADLAAHAHA